MQKGKIILLDKIDGLTAPTLYQAKCSHSDLLLKESVMLTKEHSDICPR